MQILRGLHSTGTHAEEVTVGTCGKECQSVPVGVGQPTVRIDRLTVGAHG